MFYNRQEEFELLDRLYNSNKFELLIMYGRRRVGKTTLLSQYCKDKNNIFFIGEEVNEKLLLDKFSKEIASSLGYENIPMKFDGWEEAFTFLVEESINERLMIIIDEFPYIANANKNILSLFQKIIDQQLINSNIFLILCGSSVSFMQEKVLAHKSPLFGRRTSELKVEPFNYYETSKFFKNYNEEDKILIYSILGGMPQYLIQVDPELGIKDNLNKNIFQSGQYLLEEPINLMKQEFRSPYIYNSIISAIAHGYNKINEISTKTGEPSSKVTNYLKSLILLGLVKKVKPITDKKSRKTIYEISDNYLNFYYKFVVDNKTLIEKGMGDYVVEEKVYPNLNEYVGLIFEDICRDYLWEMNKSRSLEFIFDKIGKWWGPNPHKKIQEEIDILALNKNNALFGECKFRNEKTGKKVFDKLYGRSLLINKENRYYYIFSKSGFTKALKAIESNRNDLKLISIEDIFKIDTN